MFLKAHDFDESTEARDRIVVRYALHFLLLSVLKLKVVRDKHHDRRSSSTLGSQESKRATTKRSGVSLRGALFVLGEWGQATMSSEASKKDDAKLARLH